MVALAEVRVVVAMEKEAATWAVMAVAAVTGKLESNQWLRGMMASAVASFLLRIANRFTL